MRDKELKGNSFGAKALVVLVIYKIDIVSLSVCVWCLPSPLIYMNAKCECIHQSGFFSFQ